MRQRPLVPLNNEKGTSESRRGNGIGQSQNWEEERHENVGGAWRGTVVFLLPHLWTGSPVMFLTCVGILTFRDTLLGSQMLLTAGLTGNRTTT